MCEPVQLALVDPCHFVGIAGKAAKDSRVVIGEVRAELRRILVQYGSRLLAGNELPPLNGVRSSGGFRPCGPRISCFIERCGRTHC